MSRELMMAGLCLLSTGLLKAAEERLQNGFSPASLSPAKRVQIDALAAKSRPERRAEKTVEFYGDVVGWLVSRTPLPAEEESRRAQQVHAEIINRSHIVETPARAERILKKLTATLPDRMHPKPSRFSLTVIDDAQWKAFTVGNGRLYITKPYLNALLANDKQGDDRVAFVLAHEMGHVCRGHTRRGYQLLWLQEKLDDGIGQRLDRRKLEQALKNSVRATGAVLEFIYSREQDYEADRFAVHLCRNAGFDLESCLDSLRLLAVKDDPKLLTGKRPPASPPSSPKNKKRTLPSHPSALERLKRLRIELDGIVEGDQFGLFEYDRTGDALVRVTDGSIEKGQRVVVFVHGMESDLGAYRPLMRSLAEKEPAGRLRILGFQYPSDASLSRIGKFLKGEIDRACRGPQNFDFVCHSAGGLVFRHYAEIENGVFQRAIFQGTPHAGSDLARLRPLLETKQFFGNLKLGYSEALASVIADGKGQVSFDLQPDSLFLRNLNKVPRKKHRQRYFIFRGRAIRFSQALLLQGSLTAARAGLRRKIENSDNGDLFEQASLAWIDHLRLPEEIAQGDLAVTLDSAALAGVTQMQTYRVNHTNLPRHPDVMDAVVQILLSEAKAN